MSRSCEPVRSDGVATLWRRSPEMFGSINWFGASTVSKCETDEPEEKVAGAPAPGGLLRVSPLPNAPTPGGMLIDASLPPRPPKTPAELLAMTTPTAPAFCAFLTFVTKVQVPRSMRAILPATSEWFVMAEQPSVVAAPFASEGSSACTTLAVVPPEESGAPNSAVL